MAQIRGSVKTQQEYNYMDTIIADIVVKDTKRYPKLYMRASILYYLRLEFNDKNSNDANMARSPLVLYKLGYTTTSLNERIFGKLPSYSYRNGRKVYTSGHKGMELPPNTKVYEISTYAHRNASYIYQVEQELHKRYECSRYRGGNIIGNGNTELYTVDILGLDN